MADKDLHNKVDLMWSEFETMRQQLADTDTSADTSSGSGYEVGDILITMADYDPADKHGGSWEKIEDVFLLASGTRDAEDTGGHEDLQEHSHSSGTLSTGSSTHSHSIDIRWYGVGRNDGSTAAVGDVGGADGNSVGIGLTGGTNVGGSHSHSVSGSTSSTGDGDGGNMPPYKVAHMWEKVSD